MSFSENLKKLAEDIGCRYDSSLLGSDAVEGDYRGRHVKIVYDGGGYGAPIRLASMSFGNKENINLIKTTRFYVRKNGLTAIFDALWPGNIIRIHTPKFDKAFRVKLRDGNYFTESEVRLILDRDVQDMMISLKDAISIIICYDNLLETTVTDEKYLNKDLIDLMVVIAEKAENIRARRENGILKVTAPKRM